LANRTTSFRDANFSDSKTRADANPMIKIVSLVKNIPLAWWALIVLTIATALLSPYILMPRNMANLIRQAVPSAMMAIGETFVILAGGFDLSVGSTVSLIAALASGQMAAKASNIIPSVLLCLSVGTAIGLVNGLVVTKLKVPSFLATLGMMILLQGVALVYTGGIPKGGFPDEFRQFGLGFFLNIPYIVWILIFAASFSQFFLKRSALGRSLLTVGGNDAACHLMGVKVDRVRILTFVLSSVFTALGTLLMVTTFRVWDSTMGAGMELEAIAMVIVGGAAIGGGRGSVITTILGWLVMTMLLTFLNVVGFPQSGRLLVQGLVILLAVAANRGALARVK
jgi:ribose transport system permease protein